MKIIDRYKRLPLVLLKLLLMILASSVTFILTIFIIPILWSDIAVILIEKIAKLVTISYEL